MRKMKKEFAILLALMMIIGLFAGCANVPTSTSSEAISSSEASSSSSTSSSDNVTDTSSSDNVTDTSSSGNVTDTSSSGNVTDGIIKIADRVVTGATKNNYEVAEFEKLSGTKMTFSQASMLEEKVKSGELPELSARLPSKPLVLLSLNDDDLIGVYGGKMRMNSLNGIYSMTANEFQTGFQAEDTYTHNQYANLFEYYRAVGEGKIWEFKIRDGLRWSDGEYVTTRDVEFWINDLEGNVEWTAAGISEDLRASDGKIAKYIKIDDSTFRLEWNVIVNVNERLHTLSINLVYFPTHWLKQFHPAYVSANDLAAKVEEAKVSSWVELMQNKAGMDGIQDEGKPVLTPYIWVQGDATTTYVYERNPYYFAVDAVGNQLPYIDTVTIEPVVDNEVARIKLLQGENDFGIEQGVELYTLAKENEADGLISATRWAHSATNGGVINFNQNVQDDSLREIFRQKDFRFAVSYAIDRDEINNSVFMGLSTICQASWSPNSPYYDQNAYKCAIERDVDKANALLDGIGLNQRDSEGYRLMKNGKRLELYFLLIGTATSIGTPSLTIIVDNLKDVGIFATYKLVDFPTLLTMRGANDADYQCVFDIYDFGNNEGAYWQCISLGAPYNRGFWCPLWTTWYMTNGTSGEKPVPEVLEAINAYDEYLGTINFEDGAVPMKKITTLQSENLWTIGTVSHPGYTVVYNEKLKNVPTEFRAYRRGSYGRPELWFFED